MKLIIKIKLKFSKMKISHLILFYFFSSSCSLAGLAKYVVAL